MSELHAYIAGFFDGEGCVNLARANGKEYSDEHRLSVSASQRSDRGAVLFEIQREFGGKVRSLKRVNQSGLSEISEWFIVARPLVRAFLTAMLPYLRVKRGQAELALQYLDAVDAQPRRSSRTANDARWSGSMRLTAEQLDVREGFRQRMRTLNQLGPNKAAAS